jgi:site-specific recombinase XerD
VHSVRFFVGCLRLLSAPDLTQNTVWRILLDMAKTATGAKTVARIKGVYERIPSSGIWWIRYADHRNKEHREKVGRRSDAITLYNKRKTEALQRKKLPESFRAKGITFAGLCKDALEHSAAVNTSESTYELKLKVDVLKIAFGHMKAEDIIKQDIVRWLDTEAGRRRWKPATRNRWQAALSFIFRVGIDNEKISSNPAARIKRKIEDNGRVRFLTAKEEKELKGAITDPHQLAALDISLHTGMRQSEQLGLKWSQVDLERRQLTLTRTKNGRTRHIPLNAVAVGAFESLRPKGQSKGSPVFPNASGEAVQSTRGWFEDAVKRAKLTDYQWHCNRHTFASRLVMAGVDLRTVGELMGHQTFQMTMRYAHLAPEHKVSAVDKLLQVPEQVQAKFKHSKPNKSPA